jgi:hypothetical protein
MLSVAGEQSITTETIEALDSKDIEKPKTQGISSTPYINAIGTSDYPSIPSDHREKEPRTLLWISGSRTDKNRQDGIERLDCGRYFLVGTVRSHF